MIINSISKDEINQLPLTSFKGEVKVINSKEELDNCFNKLKNSKVIGFDTETRPSFTKGISYKISLIQLATNESAYLFRINNLGLINEIKEILEDESIVKVGAAIHDDIKGLQKLSSFSPQAFIDIQNLAKELKIKSVGLRSLTAIFFNKRLSKKTKLTNWESKELSKNQISYAATDAWISLQLFHKMTEVKKGS